MCRSTSLRLAALFTVAFALAVIVLGAITLLATRAALARQFEDHILVETAALALEYRSEGLEGVAYAVRDRDVTPGALNYGLQDARGRALAGRLSRARAPLGWSVLQVPGRAGTSEHIRILTTRLPGGHRLLIGDNLERVETLDGVVLRGFAWAVAGVILLGAVGGYALSLGVNRRMAAISATAEAIIDGDLARRVPVGGSGDDLDRLAQTINSMLDRIASLMDSLRQVSTDIAHDMRTPLTRLRQRLETGLSGPAPAPGAVEAALAELDAILETFAALLRIAQIEGGARRAGFRAFDLSGLAATVVDAFAPSAEEGRRSLTLAAQAGVMAEGDPELVTQMLVNLVENALRHTPPGTRVRVSVTAGPDGAALAVTDDGPGVPAAERARVLDRFYRLEHSRSTPGSGLGLALAAAVARLHGTEVRLADAGPGLEARVMLPAARG